jgi:hypothetical protein
MILTMPELAIVLNNAGHQFINDYHKDKPQLIPGGFLMMSYILQAMDMKKRDESIDTAMNRLIEPRPALDLALEADRDALGALLKGMLGPTLGVETILVIGVTGENRTYIIHFSPNETSGLKAVDEVKELMQSIISDPNAENLDL